MKRIKRVPHQSVKTVFSKIKCQQRVKHKGLISDVKADVKIGLCCHSITDPLTSVQRIQKVAVFQQIISGIQNIFHSFLMFCEPNNELIMRIIDSQVSSLCWSAGSFMHVDAASAGRRLQMCCRVCMTAN